MLLSVQLIYENEFVSLYKLQPPLPGPPLLPVASGTGGGVFAADSGVAPGRGAAQAFLPAIDTTRVMA